MKTNNHTFQSYKSKWRLWVLALTLLIATGSSYANDIQAFIDDNTLTLSVEIAHENDNIAPKQQVLANVILSSRQPFENEMVVPYFDIANAVVKKDEQKIARSVKTIAGEKWYTQTAKLYIYPLTKGQFTIPSFKVDVSLKNDENSDAQLTGSITSKEATFNVAMPAALKGVTDFITGTDATFRLSTDTPNSDSASYAVGDAVVLTYQLKVKNSHMMLLPDLVMPDISSVEAYSKPPAKENVFDRLSKRNTAVLTQDVTLVFQQAGKLVIPPQTIKWWDTKSNQLQSLTTEPMQLQIGDSSAVLMQNNSSEVLAQFFSEYGKLILVLVSITIISAVIIARYTRRSTAEPSAKPPIKTDIQSEIKHYHCAIEKQHFTEAVDHLYKIAGNRTFNEKLDKEATKLWQQLLSDSFSDTIKTSPLSAQQAKTLLNAVLSNQSKPHSDAFNWQLNP
ncbi:BatD family protein [Vibrio ezurae]|uniref:BatD protein n=1 Tax=Vibrio ezurae NBRC 102218 TaxID=1219080 RepID=U3CF75_9VIBR|nr:BatD family protein [Vibrio ezurae]GAD79889.1 hypothetical protein VEZ01S_21_00120 [Vibrio ezurae NBRC 102218]